MRPLNQKTQAVVCFVLLCTIQAWGYTNPIDGPTTETVTDVWDLGTNSLLVGFNTDGNALIITNSGHVYSAGGKVGARLDSDNNRVLISGSGSIWSNASSLLIGPYGISNTVIVSNGGKLYSSDCQVGDQPSTLSDIVVTGAGSFFKYGTSLQVSHGSEMVVSNGGKLEGVDASLYKHGSAKISGAGSAWINSGLLGVAQDSEVEVSNGGRMESLTGNLSGAGGSATVTVTGNGSIWLNSENLNLGALGGGELIISDGGRVESGSASIDDGGKATVTGAGSAWSNAGSILNNGGSITASNGGTVSTVSLTLSSINSAFHLQSGGTLVVTGDFDADQPGDFDFSGGTLSVGGTLSNFSLLASGGRLEASDLAGDLTVHGTFAPGQSPADTMLDGAFVLAGDGTLEMELEGYLLGAEYDRLTVTGESTLDGTLSILLLDDFAPVYGSTFDLFNWDGGVGGTFAMTNLPTLGNGLSWDTDNLYTDGTVTVVPEPSTFLLLLTGLGAISAIVLRNHRTHEL